LRSPETSSRLIGPLRVLSLVRGFLELNRNAILTTGQEPGAGSVRGCDLVPASRDRELLPLVWVRATNDSTPARTRIGSSGTVLEGD
jgi:hypothetical protein